jgi:hypothetical protein
MHRSDTKGMSARNALSPEEIRKCPFEIHVERGRIHGCDMDLKKKSTIGLMPSVSVRTSSVPGRQLRAAPK